MSFTSPFLKKYMAISAKSEMSQWEISDLWYYFLQRRFSPENSNIAVNGPFKHSNFWLLSFFKDDSNRNFEIDTFRRLNQFGKK